MYINICIPVNKEIIAIVNSSVIKKIIMLSALSGLYPHELLCIIRGGSRIETEGVHLTKIHNT